MNSGWGLQHDDRKKPRLPFPVDEALHFHPRKDPIRMVDQEACGPSYLQVKRRPGALVPPHCPHDGPAPYRPLCLLAEARRPLPQEGGIGWRPGKSDRRGIGLGGVFGLPHPHQQFRPRRMVWLVVTKLARKRVERA